MKDLVQKVKQYGIDRGLDQVGHLIQAKYTLKKTASLLEAYADGNKEEINVAIGDILVTIIVGASNDEDIYRVFSNFLCSTEENYNYKVKYDTFPDDYRISMVVVDALRIIELSSKDLSKENREKLCGMYMSTIMGIRPLLRLISEQSLKECLKLANNKGI